MSDFTSNFWSLSMWPSSRSVGIVACLVLLWCHVQRKVSRAQHDKDTTGHVWDEDLREMNNPLPRWWVGLFVITIVFALVVSGRCTRVWATTRAAWAGLRKAEYDAEVAKANATTLRAFVCQRLMPCRLSNWPSDPKATAMGERLFMNNCAQCHGSDARGSKGFPNLTDGDWLHGGTPDKIKETITLGRIGQMPPMAAAVGYT
jgi:cytochrome c oxidase cbb3-type subunit 3